MNVVKKAKDKAAIKYNLTGATTQSELDKITSLEMHKWFSRFMKDFNNNYFDTGILFFYADNNNNDLQWTQMPTTQEP